ncbi:hypothetical protein ElyMa_002727000 [Elysia marginata]|uniref:Uncharacterized protein n=1 Tax=Elysia marginata TaxID=1093978 RepID=A0AAV4HEY4_9GAST|nr:hypothetical protein ElyMa_002727000 [Elysia marginata]
MYGRCDQGDPRAMDSLTSMYWPITRHSQPLTVMDKAAFTQRPFQDENEQECQNPCEDTPGCERRTSRCFEWPQPRKSLCPNENTTADFRPKRANLNVEINQPERCPTCKRCVVDMECGPLNYNY